MKRLTILSMTFLLTMGVLQLYTQKTEKETNTETKQESKTERKELWKLERGQVSDLSKYQFKLDFNKVSNVKWNRLDNFDEATFTKNGQRLTAFYDGEAKLVGTTSVKSFADLPLKGEKQIKARYFNYSVGRVIFFDDNGKNDTDMVLWGVQFEDKDSYFVELSKGNNKIIVKVNIQGEVSFFKQL
jgi:hypothetical protein